MGIDGQDSGNAAHADAHRLHAESHGHHGGDGGADHAADQREYIFQVHAEQRGLRNAQVTGNAGGNVDLFRSVVFLLKNGHGEYGGALCDVAQRDHGPEVRSVIQADQLGVDGVCHMVQSGHDDGRIQQSEYPREQHTEAGCQAAVHHVRNEVSDLPADGADNGMRDDHRGKQGAEGNHDHADDLRADLPEKFFQIDQHKAGHDGRNHLSLIADHLHLRKAEIPDRNLIRRGARHGEAVQQLGGYQRQAEHNAQDLSGSHLLCYGPDDSYGKQMEDRFSDQPQKAVGTCPELRNVRKALGSVIKKVDLSNDISEAKNQTAADQGRNKGCENLSQAAHDSLNHILVRLRSLLCRILAHALNSCVSGKFIVEG